MKQNHLVTKNKEVLNLKKEIIENEKRIKYLEFFEKENLQLKRELREIKTILKVKGIDFVDTTHDNTLIAISKMLVPNKDKLINLKIKDGYIYDFDVIEKVIPFIELPKDIKYGYYKDDLTLDLDKKKKYRRVL